MTSAGFIDKLLSSLYRSFGKEPGARIVLRVRHPAGFAWRVQARQLTASTIAGATLGTIALHGIDMNALADALEALGCSIVHRDLDLAGIAADTLLDGEGREDRSNGDALTCYTSPLWALLDAYSLALEDADASVDSALAQSRMHTSEAEWLDYWGSHFGILRGLQVLLGGDLGETETDAAYLDRIVREVLRLRVNKIAVEDAILDLAGEEVELNEPWRQVFVLDQSELSGVDHLHDGHYWTWNIIQPRIYGPATSKNWERVLKIIERNRPIGNIVATPEWIPDVQHVQAPTGQAGVGHEYLVEMHVEWFRERPLGEMVLDDNWFTFNHPVLTEGTTSIAPRATVFHNTRTWTGGWDNLTWAGNMGANLLGGYGKAACEHETTDV